MTMVWPRCLPAISDSARRWRSVEPPGGHGTISVIGLAGQACASAVPSGDSAALPAASLSRFRRLVIVCLLSCESVAEPLGGPGRPLQLDHVALGILEVDRRTFPLGAVARAV